MIVVSVILVTIFVVNNMTPTEVLSSTLGLLGIGGGLIAFFYKAKISETILDQLDKRYVMQGECLNSHENLGARFDGVDASQDRAEKRLDKVFELLVDIHRNGKS